MSNPDASLNPRVVSLSEWSSLHTHLVWIYDGPVSPAGQGSVLSWHHTAWLIRSGEVKVTKGNQSWHARAGEWFFPPPGSRNQEFTPSARILSVRFRATWPTGDNFFQHDLGLKVRAADHPELVRAATPLARFVSRNFPEAEVDLMNEPATLEVHFRLQTLFARWMETVVRTFGQVGVRPSHMGAIDPRLLEAVRWLDRRSIADPMSETVLARFVGLSVSQLNRLFLRQFGVSSRAYFEKRRIHYAVEVLENSSASIKELSCALGFISLSQFSAWFRRRLKVSPRAYRQTALQGRKREGEKS